jgi:hypothetical protein
MGAAMKRICAEKNRFTKRVYSSIITLMMMFTFVILYDLPLWACEGAAPPGENIEMKMLDPFTGETFATITFEAIKDGGRAKMAKSDHDFQSPSRYQLQTPPVYYDIAATAVYSGDVEVCINYKAMGFTNASALKVSHLTNGSWDELKTTVDWKKNMVCGTSPSLSQFAIFEDPRLLYGPGFWFQHISR